MIHTSQNAGFMIVQFPETLCCIAISAIPNMSLPCKVFCGMGRSHSSWYHSDASAIAIHCICNAGADAGFRVGGAQVAYPGFQRGECLRLGPIRKVGEGGGVQSLTTGGGGGGTVRLRRGGGGGGSRLRRGRGEGGEQSAYDGGEGGGGSPLTTGGGGGGGAGQGPLCPLVVFNFIHSLFLFILETEGGARAP